MPYEVHEDKLVMRAGQYNIPYVMTRDDVELLKWAVSTLSSFAAPDRPGGVYRFVYVPKITELRNLVQQVEAKLPKEKANEATDTTKENPDR